MPNETKATIDEGACARSPDGSHCVHWWDSFDEPCCYCGYNGGADEQAKESVRRAEAENAALRERVEAWRNRWDAMTLDALDAAHIRLDELGEHEKETRI